MDNVSSDSASLQEVLANLKNAIESVGQTRDSLKTKYVGLGARWNDRLYYELGDTIDECLRALDSVRDSLTRGREAVAALASSIAEYEELDLGSVSGGGGGVSALGIAGAAVGGLAAGAVLASALEHGGGPAVYQKTPQQKLGSLNTGLRDIEGTLENYTQSLMDRGLPRGPAMDAFITVQRQALRAELLRNINGDFSRPVRTLTDGDFDSFVSQCQRTGWINQQGSLPSPRSLPATQYGFSTQTVDGVTMNFYDDPVGTYNTLIQRQGGSGFGMEGTCGLCSCANLLTMSGAARVNEDAIISSAMDSSAPVMETMDLFNRDPAERGGTCAEGRQEILERCGLPTYRMAISSDRGVATSRLSDAVSTGHGVIVSVDVERFWRNGQTGGHAITLLSVSDDGGTFAYCDTGSGRLGTISAHDLGVALSGRPANVTVNIIR